MTLKSKHKRKADSPTQKPSKHPNSLNTYLKRKHPHSRDQFITFDESTHTYFVDWDMNGFFEKNDVSVSSFYKPYFPTFDADAVIQKMMNGKRWSKSRYFGMTKEEIKTEWAQISLIACERGTIHHGVCESYYNGNEIERPLTKVGSQFMSFVEDHKDWKPFRSEWILYSDKSTRICGTPDMLFYTPKRTNFMNVNYLHLTMFDWKTSKKISKKNFFENGLGMFSHLPNSNYYHYALQLNIYKYMLENFYAPFEIDGEIFQKIVIDGMFLVVMHENRDSYCKIQLPDFRDDVHTMFENRRRQLSDEC
jgi:hypothetical protein